MIPDLNQLTCFVVVAEELHFGRAAERLCMTQPPLTRQIQALEHSLGVKLFERTSRTVRLTTAGCVFLTDATRLLNMAKQAAATARRVGKGEAGRITIGFTSVMGFDLIPNLVASAEKALPDFDVVLNEMVTVAQLQALENNTIDLGFLWPLANRLPLKHNTVFRDPLVVALPVGHPLATGKRVALEDLNGLPFVMFSPGQGTYFYSLIQGLLISAGVTPKFVQHVDQVLSVVNLVRSGIGVSIVPASVSQFHPDKVVFRPMSRNDVLAEGRMTWRADYQNPALATFLGFASKFFAEREAAR